MVVYGVQSGTGKKFYLSGVSTAYSFFNVDVSTNATVSGVVFSSLRLESSSSFSLFEISARSSVCSEFVTLDLGSSVTVTGVTGRHWSGSNTAGSVQSTWYEGSTDGANWTPLQGPVNPQLMSSLDVDVNSPLSVRFVRIRHVLVELKSVKVMLWELSVWGSSGRYGAVAARLNPVTFRDLIGVNGIWGFGRNSYSSSLTSYNGPGRFSKSSKHARNYHNWIWDSNYPGTTPNFDRMVLPGSKDFGVIPGPRDSALNQQWLNWDNEYTTWKTAGLEVEASIQFTPSDFPQSVFSNPYQAGYNYGFAFAKHFGRTYGTGDVSTMEVGNEPWIAGMGYSNASFYRSVLLGMSRGAKDADPSMRVLPAAFGNLEDTLARVTLDHVPYLDAWNVHAYSWMGTALGRTGVHPEHPMSTLNSVNSYLRFRDANTPDMPVYLTEWGWDSAGGGEDCNPPPERSGDAPFPECVSEAAQALYAVRGALVLARKGLSRLTWYFYGNTVVTPSVWDKAKGLFGRSGLTSSSAAGFKNKLALYALEQLVAVIGNDRFHSVIREDRDAYVYALTDSVGGDITKIVAWRPVSADIDVSLNASVNVDQLGGRMVKHLSTIIPGNTNCDLDNNVPSSGTFKQITVDRCVKIFAVLFN